MLALDAISAITPNLRLAKTAIGPIARPPVPAICARVVGAGNGSRPDDRVIWTVELRLALELEKRNLDRRTACFTV
jgi:hypothetical protein